MKLRLVHRGLCVAVIALMLACGGGREGEECVYPVGELRFAADQFDNGIHFGIGANSVKVCYKKCFGKPQLAGAIKTKIAYIFQSEIDACPFF